MSAADWKTLPCGCGKNPSDQALCPIGRPLRNQARAAWRRWMDDIDDEELYLAYNEAKDRLLAHLKEPEKQTAPAG